jgi:dGTPase
MGRSFGLKVSKQLYEKSLIDEVTKNKIPSALAVSCLVHDIGNPPFGHYGEKVIGTWFERWFTNPEYCKLVQQSEDNRLSEQQINDLVNFEGNAQALRILTKLQFLNDKHGINFTYGTLAVLIKYPCSSLDITDNNKKFGYFESENTIFNTIENKTGLDGNKHPLTYLLEAADDICYLAADIEDGVKKCLMNWEEVYREKILPIIKNDYNITGLEEKRKKALDNKVPDRDLIDAQNFRVWIQGIMLNEVAEEFISKYDQLMEGKYSGKLLDNCSSKLQKLLEGIGIEYCYQSSEALALELVGDKVISGLLDIFVPEITKDEGSFKPKNKAGKLYHVISPNFRYIQKLDENGIYNQNKKLKLYDRLLLITDFISGMTDSYAVDLFQKLSGVKLP